MYNKLIAFGEEANIPKILRAYVDNSAEAIDELIELGLNPITVFPQNGVNVAFGNGMKIIGPLTKIIEQIKVPFLFDTLVTKLITDNAGKVLGVEAEGKTGKTNIKANKGVILATGGFAADMELFDRHLVTAKGAYWGVSPTHTGNGLRMASRIGADTTHMPFAGTYDAGFPVSKKTGERHALLVLRQDAYDKPIPGLYAAGEVVGGIMGTMYDGGSCIGSGLTFGRIAGKSAAANV